MADTKPKNWGREEDARLHILWRKKSKNGKKPLIDTTKLDKPYVLAQTLAGSHKQEAEDEEDEEDNEDYKPDEEVDEDVISKK